MGSSSSGLVDGLESLFGLWVKSFVLSMAYSVDGPLIPWSLLGHHLHYFVSIFLSRVASLPISLAAFIL